MNKKWKWEGELKYYFWENNSKYESLRKLVQAKTYLSKSVPPQQKINPSNPNPLNCTCVIYTPFPPANYKVLYYHSLSPIFTIYHIFRDNILFVYTLLLKKNYLLSALWFFPHEFYSSFLFWLSGFQSWDF